MQKKELECEMTVEIIKFQNLVSTNQTTVIYYRVGLGMRLTAGTDVYLIFFTFHKNDFPGNKLTLDDLQLVLEEVLDVSAQWYHLGVQLKLKTGTLDNIQAQFSDPKRQLLEMLKTWLSTSDNTSWKTLTNVLRSPVMGKNQLADILDTKYGLVKITEGKSDGLPETTVTPTSQVSEQVVSTPQPKVADLQENKCE